MFHAIIWKCDNCRAETETRHPQEVPGRCECGGTFHEYGEAYDQEFVEEQQHRHKVIEEADRYRQEDDYGCW